MLKSIFTAASFAVVVATIGCSGAPDSSSDPSSSALSDDSTSTITLAAATTKINAIRASFDPKSTNALIFDPTLAVPYLAAVKPVFAEIKPTDTINLGAVAFTYVSSEIQSLAIFDNALFDHAVADYDGVHDFTSYWGQLAGTNTDYWTKLADVISNSSAGQLSDLQILELVMSTNSGTLEAYEAGLTSLGWSTAPHATAADAAKLFDASAAFTSLDQALLGNVFGPDGHDIDVTDTLAVEVFKRSYSELRLLPSAGDPGSILVDLGSHIAGDSEFSQVTATNAIALTKSVLTASELKTIDPYLQ